MTPGLIADIRCLVRPYSILRLQIKSEIRLQVKWAVNMMIADGYFNLPQGF